MQSIMRGTVTSLSPFRVQIDGLDLEGQPCQRTAPATLGQSGGVDTSGPQRVWVGAYDADPVDLAPLTTRVSALEGDTGWLAITPATGVTGSIQYRATHGAVYLRGLALLPENLANAFAQLGSIPLGRAPVGESEERLVPSTRPQLAHVLINTSGAISVRDYTLSGTSAVARLDGITWLR